MARFCTTCQRTQNEDGGVKKPNSTRGWICKNCNEKITESIYLAKSGRACDVATLMKKLYAKTAEK